MKAPEIAPYPSQNHKSKTKTIFSVECQRSASPLKILHNAKVAVPIMSPLNSPAWYPENQDGSGKVVNRFKLNQT